MRSEFLDKNCTVSENRKATQPEAISLEIHPRQSICSRLKPNHLILGTPRDSNGRIRTDDEKLARFNWLNFAFKILDIITPLVLFHEIHARGCSGNSAKTNAVRRKAIFG